MIDDHIRNQGANLARLTDEKVLAMLKKNGILVEDVRRGDYRIEAETSQNMATMETVTRYTLFMAKPLDQVTITQKHNELY